MPKNRISIDEYQPHNDESRFSYWGYAITGIEHCYTEDELDFRDDILSFRSSSGIPSVYLSNRLNWFDSEMDNAFTELNADSWFFRSTFKPRDRVSIDDFRWRSIDPKSLQCPVNSIGKFIGDYLQVRNRNLADEHLNQPMNFVLMDVQHMLAMMAKDSNDEQVKAGLQGLQNYLTQVKMKLPAIKGNDRHFLTRLCDQKLADQIEQLNLSRDIWVFREMVERLETGIDYIELVAQTKAHFSLTVAQVNEHVYLPDEMDTDDILLERFPVMAVRNCMEQGKLSRLPQIEASNNKDLQQDESFIQNCPELKLVDGLSSEEQHDYITVHQNLDRLRDVKKIIKDLKTMLDTTGEVMLAYHFSKPIQRFTEELRDFLHDFQAQIKKMDRAQAKYFFNNSQQLQKIEQSGWFNQILKAGQKKRMERYNQNSQALEGSLFNLDSMDKLISEAQETASKIAVALRDMNAKDIPAITEDVIHLKEHFLTNIHGFIGEVQWPQIDEQASLTPLQKLSKEISDQSTTDVAILKAECQPPIKQEATHCKAGKYNVLLVQKPDKDDQTVPKIKDEQYELKDCVSVKYQNQPAVACQGEESVAIVSESTFQPVSLFQAIPGQLALAYLVGKLLGNALASFYERSETGTVEKFLIPENTLQRLKDKLAEAKVLIEQTDDLDGLDFLELYNELLESMAEQPFTKQEQVELELDINYFIDCLKQELTSPQVELQKRIRADFKYGFFTPEPVATLSQVSNFNNSLKLK